jgi:molybdenum cofactor synthesis domain-containing protein
MPSVTKKTDRQMLTEHFTKARPLRALVITLSDRASAGVYADKSGPKLREHVEQFFSKGEIPIAVESALLPDDAVGLREKLVTARDAGIELVFTTGGTGVGPRDNTPDVVLELADKVIPGIMDLVRLKYGAEKPCALISRSVAAVMGQSVVYAIPGSSKAVDEYMGEILKSIEHVICTVHGLDVH